MGGGAPAVLENRSPPIQSGLRDRKEVILEFRDIQDIVQDPCPSTIVCNLDFPNSHCRETSADTADEYGSLQSSEFEELFSIGVHMMGGTTILDPTSRVSSD